MTVNSPASACQAWAKLWPTIDQVTINGDLAPFTTLIGTGGPGQALFALTDWATGQLNSPNPTGFSDDINIALHQLTSLEPGDNTAPLRQAGVTVNQDCLSLTSQTTTTSVVPTGQDQGSPCSTGSLEQAYVDQGGTPPIQFVESSCDAGSAIAVGPVQGSSAYNVAIFRIVGHDDVLMATSDISKGETTAETFGISGTEYSQLTGALRG